MGDHTANQGRGALPRVVIVGGGFAGLYAAKALRNAPVQLTLLDRTNHHVFQPLLYQVATASLSPEQITAPIRSVLSRQGNTEVLMAEVTGVDTQRQLVLTRDQSIPYDYLILATGSRHSYFGHPEWERYAAGLKETSDARAVRRNILLAFEAAEMESDPELRKACLTFVLVGAGPTGVEMAGQIAEMAQVTLSRDFRHIDPKSARILLVEAGPRILPSYNEKLAERSRRYLEQRGVEVRTGKPVTVVDAEGVNIGDERIPTRTVFWAAGNVSSPAGKWIGAELDRAGRAKVTPNLTAGGHDNIFVIGDAAHFEQDGKPLPGVAQPAIQMGQYAASVIRARVQGWPDPLPFRYFNKGDMATVGRKFAIYDLDELKTRSGKRLFGPIRFGGFFAWLMWMAVHIFFLIGFANRLLVMINWMWAYLTFQRGARLITPDVGPDAVEPAEYVSPHRTHRNEVYTGHRDEHENAIQETSVRDHTVV